MSNEHLDMSGNPSDAPLECHWCHKEVREEKAYGSESDDTLLFCSGDCVDDWEYSIMNPDEV
jgi:hypothetical protein